MKKIKMIVKCLHVDGTLFVCEKQKNDINGNAQWNIIVFDKWGIGHAWRMQTDNLDDSCRMLLHEIKQGREVPL